MNSVLFDIITCEHDLRLHCMAEDRLFVPAVKKLEAKAAEKCGGVVVEVKSSDQTYGASVKASDLSEREREIVWCVAKGMSNKEIASHLCLSVHTVTTHRRNISAKLQIHSTAGITIFAIVNGLLTPDEIGVK